jgi:hypothetical protein
MSDATPSTPEIVTPATATSPAVELDAPPTPEVQVENPVPDNIDALYQSTARFTRQGWNYILAFKDDMNAVAYRRFRMVFQCNEAVNATELKQALEAESVAAVQQKGDVLSTYTTLAKLQKVVKNAGLKTVELTLMD